MKINGRELLPHEAELFNVNPRNSAGIRVVGFLTDSVIFVLMLITTMAIGGWSVWIFYVIYSFLLLITVMGLFIFINKDPREVDAEMRSRLICYSNSSVDWPFGFLGVFSTTKNFLIMLASIPLAFNGYVFLAALLPICWIVNNMTIYARGTLTLRLIDYILKQNEFAAD